MSARIKGLTRTPCPWGLLWEGTAEQLVDAGVLTAAQAEARQQWEHETVKRYGHLQGRRMPPLTLASGRRATVRKALGRRNAWAVSEDFDERELAAEDVRRAQAAQARRMLERYGTPERARRTLETMLREGLVGVLCAFNAPSLDGLPYRFDADTCAAVTDLARQLMAAFERGTLAVGPLPDGVEFERFLRSIMPE
jgi:hypothetical protein